MPGRPEKACVRWGATDWVGAGRTISSPSTAHKAARFALPWETPNSSNTAVNDKSNEIMDWAEMMFAVVRCAKNWIYSSG